MHAFHWGRYDRFKRLSTLQSSRCCVCDQYSECTVERWRSWFYIQMIPVWILAKGYLFTWSACGHSMGMDDPVTVSRYKEEHVDTELFVLPPCRELKALDLVRPMPFNLKNFLILLPLILIIIGLLIVMFWGVFIGF